MTELQNMSAGSLLNASVRASFQGWAKLILRQFENFPETEKRLPGVMTIPSLRVLA